MITTELIKFKISKFCNSPKNCQNKPFKNFKSFRGILKIWTFSFLDHNSKKESKFQKTIQIDYHPGSITYVI